MMLAKTALLLRSLVVASFLGGLVACTFDQPSDEHDKESTSAIHAGKNKSADGGTAKGADGGIDDSDASVIDRGADGGVEDIDAGPYDADGGTGWGVDSGYEGDDDDDFGADAGAGEWGADGGAW